MPAMVVTTFQPNDGFFQPINIVYHTNSKEFFNQPGFVVWDMCPQTLHCLQPESVGHHAYCYSLSGLNSG